MNSFDTDHLIALLPEYYKWLFPFKHFFQWLRYGQDDYFRRREFALVREGDIYIRYQSFDNQAEMQSSITSVNPSKIDIGAVFNGKVTSFQADERELVFDIDLTDYDDILYYVLCIIALHMLSEDFGFQERLWVFSGRRGVHCWVTDRNARRLNEAGRSAIADYLTVVSVCLVTKKVASLNRFLHPSVKRAIDIIRPHFCDLLKEQGWLDSADQWAKVLDLISDEDTCTLFLLPFTDCMICF
ncbi:unnamed protein product [Soboliphyme baturini]|uniref:DNA primase small subunit n=1 Tax=Soboliphyme baturini TaxID=241478 RepID=A0A183IMP3_9BILA|nr:unnamed protein product [Soboliphyme baturini]